MTVDEKIIHIIRENSDIAEHKVDVVEGVQNQNSNWTCSDATCKSLDKFAYVHMKCQF